MLFRICEAASPENKWGSPQNCKSGKICKQGKCTCPTTTCSIGQRRCQGDSIEICRVSSNSTCPAFQKEKLCGVQEPMVSQQNVYREKKLGNPAKIQLSGQANHRCIGTSGSKTCQKACTQKTDCPQNQKCRVVKGTEGYGSCTNETEGFPAEALCNVTVKKRRHIRLLGSNKFIRWRKVMCSRSICCHSHPQTRNRDNSLYNTQTEQHKISELGSKSCNEHALPPDC